jgi:hypothetical protein
MKKLFLGLLVIMVIASGCMAFVPAIAAFDVAPNTISAGSSANLIWNVAGVQSVTISPGLGTVPAAGTVTVKPNSTTAYTITAIGPFGTVSKSVILTVIPVPVQISLTANPTVLQAGSQSTLQWNVSGADAVTIDQGIGDVPIGGSKVITPPQTTTYTLTARNSSGQVSRSVIVTVNPPITADFTVSPTTTTVGQPVSLSWNVTGADTITIDQGVGPVPASGSRTVTPNSTTSYTLTASSSCCVLSRAAVVTVGTVYPYGYNNYWYNNIMGPPYDYYPYMYPYGSGYPPYGGYQGLTPFIEIFSINPPQVHAGQPSLLHWNVVGASTVTITGIGNVPPNGSQIVNPAATTTYVMTASNAYSATTKSVTLQIVP